MEWREATLDQLNILLWLDQDEAARRLLLNRWIEDPYVDREFATQLAILAGELAPKRKDWEVLLKALEAQKYQQLERYSELIEAHARMVLYYLRARHIRMLFKNNKKDLKHINQVIALLEQGHILDKMWQPICTALAEEYADRGLYIGKQQNYSEALTDFNRSLMLRSDDPATLHNRGVTKSYLSDFIGALDDYNTHSK